MWAVIKTGGKQYKVAVGETIAVEKLEGKDNNVTFEEVLLIDGEKLQIGMPFVEKAKVTGKIQENFKGSKIRVVKFKPKAKYTRTSGHRQTYTRVLIEKISA